MVLAAALAVPLGFLGAGTATAASAPGSAVSTSVSATVVASSINVKEQTLQFGVQFGAIDPSRNRLYVGLASKTPYLAQVDLTTGTATKIPLGGGAYAASDAAVSPLDGTVYVSHNSYAPGVSVLDPGATYTDTAWPPIITALPANPQQLDAGADGRVYALHAYLGTISVIGASPGAKRMDVVQSLTGLASVEGDMAIDNDRNRLYVVGPASRTLTIIDTKADPAVELGVITLSDSPVGVGVDAATGEVLVTSIDTNSVSWLDVAGDSQSVTVTRTEALSPLPTDAEPWSLPTSPTVRADGTTFVVTRVYYPASPKPSIQSQVTVIPAVVSATDPISTLKVGFGASSGILDPRAGGTLYVPNSNQGTISEISDVTLSAYATSAEVGSAGALRATLTRSDARQLTGTVTFSDASASVLGAVAIDASGTSELPVGSQPVGDLPFTVAVTAPSTIPLTATGTLTTAKAASATTLTLAAASVIEGSSTTAALDVTGAAGVAAAGSFTIATTAGDVLASGTVTGGQATATFTVPLAGTTPLVARFDGDANYRASASAAVDLVVTARTPEATAPSETGAVGSAASVDISGFLPGEPVTVTLHSDPVTLGTIQADSSGSGTLRFTVPVVPAGLHHIIAVGTTSGRTSTIPFSVTGTIAPAATPTAGQTPGSSGETGTLASTGVDTALALWASGLLLLLGAGGIASVRARRDGRQSAVNS